MYDRATMADESKNIPKLTKALESLEDDVEAMDTTLEKSIKAQGYLQTFFRGVAGAVGAAIGATVIIGLIVYILQKLAGVPFIGHFILNILQQLQQGK